MDGDEFEPLGQGQQIVRNSSIVEMHNDLDAVNEDEFDKILEKDKAERKGKN